MAGEDDDDFDLESSMAETLKEITTEGEIEEEDVEDVEDEAGPERDERGRFKAKAELEDEQEPEPEEQPEITDEVVEEAAPPPEVPRDLLNPPPTWTAEAKSLWKDVPVRIRQEVMKREADSARGVEQIRERASFGDRMERVVSPYRALLQSEGATPEQAVEGLMNTAYTLRQGMPAQKVQLTIEMAQRYGFLNELVAHMQGNGQNTQQGGQFNQALAPLQQKIMDLERQLQQKQQGERESEEQRYQAEAERFINETDEAGNLKHPFFHNVREVMVGLLNAGSAQTYEDAYQQAVWSNPETRKIVEAEQEQQRQAKAQADAKARAAKAKKAQTVNLRPTGTHGADAPKKPLGSIDDTMRETLQKVRESA